MSADFSQLSKLQLNDKRTVDYKLFQIAGEPSLTLLPTGEANKPYFNAVLKRAKTSVRRLRAGGLTAAMMAETRNEDRKLFPRYVVTGWTGIVDAAGKAVEFSVENCEAFLAALPDWIFDEVRSFAGDPNNFLAEDEAGTEDVEDSKGN